ncbi:hypothetical protein HpMS107_54460 [Helicobacter pylori]
MAPLMVAVVIVAEAILLPAPPISVMSTEASCEQSTTGATTCNVVAVVVEPVLVEEEPEDVLVVVLELPSPPQPARLTAATQMVNDVRNEVAPK